MTSGTLNGRVALVTGASRGIGKAIALELARHGCRVVLSARTETPAPGIIGSLEATRQEIEALGAEAIAVRVDLSLDEDLERLRDEALSGWGRVDILINNAAVMLYYVPLLEASAAQFDEEFRVNVRAPFRLAQLFAPGMAERGGGVVINISSRTAELPAPPDPQKTPRAPWASVTYAPTKAALNRLSAGLAHDLAPWNVAVVVLYPGFTLTERMVADPPPGMDVSRAEGIEGVTAAVVRICEDPMSYTGRVVGWGEVLA